MSGFLALALTVSAAFEGGSVGRVQPLGPSAVRCGVKGERDQDGRNRQAHAYYFRVDGVEGARVTVDLIDLPGEYKYRPNRGAVTCRHRPVL